MRKFALAALLAIAGIVALAPAASAEGEVEVHNPGMFYIEGTNNLSLQQWNGTAWVDALRCDNEWEANISASGHVDIHDVVFRAVAGSSPACAVVNDCNDAGWEGQIHETEESSTQEHEFSIVVPFCLNIAGQIRTGEVECGIEASEAHCMDARDHTFPNNLRVVGEIGCHWPIDIEHLDL